MNKFFNIVKGTLSNQSQLKYFKHKLEKIEQAADFLVQGQSAQRNESIPFMITKQMRLDLLGLGYDVEDIKHMTPQAAHDILNVRQKKQQ
ncbi:hypothetical protein pb186bvf_001084 [Paramecium bursaria]